MPARIRQNTYHAPVQVFKILYNTSLNCDLFSYTIDVTGHAGRNPHRLYVPSERTNYGKRLIKYCGTLDLESSFTCLYNAKSLFLVVIVS